MSGFTPLEEIPKIRDIVRAGFATNKSRDVKFRKEQLIHLGYMLQDNEQRFLQALKADLGRPALETTFLEVSACINEIKLAHSNVAKWAKPEGVPFDFNTFLMRGKVRKDPQGTVLIIGPFNYPIWCVITPLVGAIAAGCAAVVKPSELASSVERLFIELFPKYLDQDFYRVVSAEIPGTTKLLELQWDHIMYTGNGTVGRIVATAAAKHLTPVSLELGGKSPVIVDKSADLKLVAKRILWAKMVNAGQTCVAPDYMLVTDGREDKLVEAFKETYATYYPEGPAKSESFSRICADRHFERLKKLLDSTSGRVILGGETDAATKYIAPTVVANVKPDDSLMSQELFGPILPILSVPTVDDAIEFVRARDHPLALYIFSSNNKNKEKILNTTQSGMAMVNDCIVGAAVPGLGFGGTGPSGYGQHSDKAGFDSFTHRRSTIDVPGFLDWVLFWRFPPYTKQNHAISKVMLQRKFRASRPGMLSFILNWKTILTVVALAVSYSSAKRSGKL